MSALADHVARTPTVAIVTTRRDGTEAATPIWAVAVEGTVYVRSAYGDGAVWHRRARSGRPVAFALTDGARAERDPDAVLGDPRAEVRVTAVAAEPELDAVDAAYREKYAGSPVLHTVLTPEARGLTLRADAV